MPTELLQSGTTVISDAAVRAIPPRVYRMFITGGGATSVDISNNFDMSGAKNVVPTDAPFLAGGQDISGGFIRVNGGAATVRLVKF